ncbi:zinc finger protein ZPR1 [Corythoichthys intestinalis]|uniref:zinc finger protein ZPR1 n=1 Tax=Corythoichthys intestinalis TaxID=161448 RepID=UPI0025A63E43|nr:zinc finger protein ZPR1 [Corythoichthys intestinalis]XP_061813515.1 zinc finger protein ZPR1-like [Nerophis lumbriciformis]
MSVIAQEHVRGGNVFKDLSADDEDWQPTEIESLCMNCYQNGTTRLLLTKIPFFKEIIVSSFSCDQCRWSNTEIQSAGRIQEQGVCYTLKVTSKHDLNREVVKMDSATTRIPELDFEIPPFTQKGALSTVEGLLDRAVAGLEQDQAARREADPEVADKIHTFLQKLKKLKDVDEAFTVVIEDPSGNSFVENPSAPLKDEALTVSWFRRSAQQEKQLGLRADDESDNDPPPGDDLESMRGEVLVFNTNCPECNAPASTNMKLVQIPHFKEAIIMATICDSCGHRTNEVKSGGATEDKGTKITLRITSASDMTRDLLKSETCSVFIPELDFELGMAALCGKFTTVEGLLTDIKDLVVAKNPFVCGDSGDSSRADKLKEFGEKIDSIIAGRTKARLILDDPAGNSYLENVYVPEPDPEMTVEIYERTFEQNEELGLNDMKTENYQDDN